MVCDVLTSSCGTIEPVSISQLINFNFVMSPHLHTLFTLPGVFPVNVQGSSSLPLSIAGVSAANILPVCPFPAACPSQPDFLLLFPEKCWVLLLGEVLITRGFKFSTNPTDLDSSRAGLCETEKRTFCRQLVKKSCLVLYRQVHLHCREGSVLPRQGGGGAYKEHKAFFCVQKGVLVKDK